MVSSKDKASSSDVAGFAPAAVSADHHQQSNKKRKASTLEESSSSSSAVAASLSEKRVAVERAAKASSPAGAKTMTTALASGSNNTASKNNSKTKSGRNNVAASISSKIGSRRRRNNDSSSSGGGNTTTAKDIGKQQQDAWKTQAQYTNMSLQDIHDRILSLCIKVPVVPDDNFVKQTNAENIEEETTKEKQQRQPIQQRDNNTTNNNTSFLPEAQKDIVSPHDKERVRSWARTLQTILEEYNLLLSLVSPSTYAWGTDRSGAAEQNLNILSQELIRSQEQLLARVAPRLNDVLAPVQTLVTAKTVTTKQTNPVSGLEEETKQNFFVNAAEDPDYVELCFSSTANNAVLLRQVVLSNLEKTCAAIKDYLTASAKDSQQDQASRSFAY